MRLNLSALLYIAAGACAIAAAVLVVQPGRGGAGSAAVAGGTDAAALAAMLEDDMKKLVFHDAPKPVSAAEFEAGDGGTGRLADYRGRIALVNFWATWCAPCRKEMPMLADLQRRLGGADFAVVTIATGRNPPQAMKDFFAEIGVDNLPMHRDPGQKVAREMGIVALPTTVLLDREGREIARMMGDASWNSPSALAMLRRLIADSAPPRG
ncbi:MAG: TlpA disulfide reductase family protein [Roseovarius sp.]